MPWVVRNCGSTRGRGMPGATFRATCLKPGTMHADADVHTRIAKSQWALDNVKKKDTHTW